MSKILLIDIDGTLVDYENCLPASAVDAIRKARANGHKVYLCSGRSKAENKQEIWDIGIDGYIGGNGSYVESDGVVVDNAKVTCTYKKKGLFSSKSTEFPTQPGIYTQTATVSGNYSCEKITRTIIIN